jgi:TonB-linked SusC/RagA family outer membrane protein
MKFYVFNGGRLRVYALKFLLAMKLTIVLLITVFLQVSLAGHAQKITCHEKNVSLKRAFSEIQNQTQLRFLYTNEMLKGTKTIDLDFDNASITEVLNKCFDQQPLTYTIKNKTIVVQRKTIAQAAPEPAIFQTVKGKVTDQAGLTLAGVIVTLKGRQEKTVTDASGNYSLSIPASESNPVLLFSFVGYDTREVPVGGKTVINVQLTESNSKLNDVVVIGYGTTSRRNLTTAIAKIDPKQISKAANSSIPNLLFGKAAGLQVTQQSAEPDGQIDLSIRGKGSPIYVVDGIVYPNSGLDPGNGDFSIVGGHRGALAGLNPNDIESIEVLKDASAAIYGVTAGNGVVLITTKKGKAGKMSISYDGSKSFTRNLPYLKSFNATDYQTYFNQLNRDKFLADNNMAPFGSVQADLSRYTPKFSATDIQAASVGTDWVNEVLRNGGVDNHNLSISGGTDRLTYFVSGNYFNQVGTIKASGLEKYTGRANLIFKLRDWVSLNISANGGKNKTLNPSAGNQKDLSGAQGYNALQAALAYPAYIPIRDNNGEYSLFTGFAAPNPVSALDIMDKTIYNSSLTTMTADFTIIPGALTAKALYGVSNESSYRNFYIPSTVYFALTKTSKAYLGQSRREKKTAEASFSYKKTFGQLNIDAVAGVGQYITDLSSNSAQAINILDPINTDNIGSGQNPKISSFASYNKERSFFARTNFNYLDKYLLSLSLRRDGSDKFYPGKKYASFPSASIGWKLSEESFLKKIKGIDLIKLRASYGKTGDLNGLANSAYGGYTSGGSILPLSSGVAAGTAIVFADGIVNIPYLLTALNNPNLTWPATKTFNAGLDFAFLNNRISGSVDWFNENITDLLLVSSTAPLSQIGTAPINGGGQRRRGFDINLNTTNIQSDAFKWNSTINISHFDYRWQKRFENVGLSPYIGTTDQVNSIYNYETNGILQIGQQAPAWQPLAASKPGSPIYVDKNNDGKLNYLDVVRHSMDPQIIIGFGNTFQYKDFDLNIFFYGQKGAWGNDYASIYTDAYAFLMPSTGGSDGLRKAWSTANTSGTLPSGTYNESALGLDAPTNIYLIKRDFIKCRNITAGYNFSSPAVKKYVNSLRIYFDVQNAFLISNYKTFDPEINNASGGNAPYPMARTFSLGVNATF